MTFLPTEQTRIVIIGTSGSGKTTLARQIAAKRGLEHIELDVLHHGPGWTRREDFCERVTDAVTGKAWVCDGNYSSVRDTVWARATAFVWLDYPLPLTFARGLTRTVRRVVSQEEVFPGCRETFRQAFLSSTGIPAWIVRTHYRHRRTYPSILGSSAFRNVPLLRLRNPAQSVDFLTRL